MTSLVVPGLDTLRQWLDDLGMSFFECDNCQALHLPHTDILSTDHVIFNTLFAAGFFVNQRNMSIINSTPVRVIAIVGC
ncbi:YbjN domain-containing protein, partial [Escherichia coli]